jgi:hypothetical protein
VTTLPPPLVDAEVDLRDFAFMPLDVARLRDSDLAAEENPETCWYAVLLWCSAWHQVPAASLPDNDSALMRLVGLGRDKRTWARHRDGALRGFVKCADGRLYHKQVAEKANAAWLQKLAQRHRTFCAAIRKHNSRNKAQPLEAPDFDQWLALGRPSTVTASKDQMSQGQKPNVTVTGDKGHDDIGSKGEGEGEGESKEDTGVSSNARTPKHTRKADWPEIPEWVPIEPWNAFCKMRKDKRAPLTGRAVELILKDLTQWASSGQDPGEVLDQSTKNSWTGLFELKDDRNGRKRTAPATGNSGDGLTRVAKRWANLGDAQGASGEPQRASVPTGQGDSQGALALPEAGHG